MKGEEEDEANGSGAAKLSKPRIVLMSISIAAGNSTHLKGAGCPEGRS